MTYDTRINEKIDLSYYNLHKIEIFTSDTYWKKMKICKNWSWLSVWAVIYALFCVNIKY